MPSNWCPHCDRVMGVAVMTKPFSFSITSWHIMVITIALSVAFMWPTWAAFNGYWLESTRYSHGHLIVLISAYLLYQQKAILDEYLPRPSFLAVPVLASLIFVWLVAVLGSIQALQMIVTPLLIWVLCLALLGWQLARRLILGVGYLYLAVPVWGGGQLHFAVSDR